MLVLVIKPNKVVIITMCCCVLTVVSLCFYGLSMHVPSPPSHYPHVITPKEDSLTKQKKKKTTQREREREERGGIKYVVACIY